MSEVKVVILNWNGYAHLRTFLPSVLRDTPENCLLYTSPSPRD